MAARRNPVIFGMVTRRNCAHLLVLVVRYADDINAFVTLTLGIDGGQEYADRLEHANNHFVSYFSCMCCVAVRSPQSLAVCKLLKILFSPSTIRYYLKLYPFVIFSTFPQCAELSGRL